nr:DUF4440 domain-containing protein [Frankia sp. Cas4]
MTSARTASSRRRRDHRGYAVSEYPSDVDVALNLTLPSDQLTEVANAVRPGGRRFLTITYPVPQQEWIGRDDVALHFVLDMDGTFGGMREVGELALHGELPAAATPSTRAFKHASTSSVCTPRACSSSRCETRCHRRFPEVQPTDDTTARQEDHVITDIRELQQAFDNAELHADTDRLNTLLADDFMSIGERGYQLNKRQWIDRHADFAYHSLETSELDVRRYDHAAIVRCVQRSRASWRGEVMTLTVRLSQVWVELPDGWRLAGIQFSSLDPA